jgi:hypothetical protein
LPRSPPHPLWVSKYQTSSQDDSWVPAATQFVAESTGVHDGLTPSTNWSCIIDIGVYTKNRAFRLLGSRKYGEGKIALSTAASNEFEPGTTFRSCLASSLVVPCELACFESDERPLTHSKYKILSMPLAKPVFPFVTTLVVPLELSWLLPLHSLQLGDRPGLTLALVGLPSIDRHVQSTPKAASLPAEGSSAEKKSGDREVGRAQYQRWFGERTPSPFTAIDEFVEDFVLGRSGRGDDMESRICTIGREQPGGYLRSWSLSHSREVTVPSSSLRHAGRWTITYQVDKANRYCERIRRPHKSNTIMISVSFRAASLSTGPSLNKEYTEIDSGGMRQRCWDPECRGFDFTVHPLPPMLLLWLRELFLKWGTVDGRGDAAHFSSCSL